MQDHDDKKMQVIMTQKWIQSFGNGVEAYNDYRRTGYPILWDPSNNNMAPNGFAQPPAQEILFKRVKNLFRYCWQLTYAITHYHGFTMNWKQILTHQIKRIHRRTSLSGCLNIIKKLI